MRQPTAADVENWRARGENCKQARKSICATQAETAFYLKGGFTFEDVSKMENGLKDPTPLEAHWFRGVA